MQITDLIRDSPLRDLGTVLSQCTHVIVPIDEEDDSFEYDPEEEVPIGGKDDDDQTDEDYEPGGMMGQSDMEGGRSKEGEGVFGVAIDWEGNKEGEGEIQKGRVMTMMIKFFFVFWGGGGTVCWDTDRTATAAPPFLNVLEYFAGLDFHSLVCSLLVLNIMRSLRKLHVLFVFYGHQNWTKVLFFVFYFFFWV